MADKKKCPFCKREDAMIRLHVINSKGPAILIASYPPKGSQEMVYLWVCQYCGKSEVRK